MKGAPFPILNYQGLRQVRNISHVKLFMLTLDSYIPQTNIIKFYDHPNAFVLTRYYILWLISDRWVYIYRTRNSGNNPVSFINPRHKFWIDFHESSLLRYLKTRNILKSPGRRIFSNINTHKLGENIKCGCQYIKCERRHRKQVIKIQT